MARAHHHLEAWKPSMAQDFYSEFRLGGSERTISSLDVAGVALAAIKGLDANIKEKDQQIEELRATLADQERRLSEMSAMINTVALRLEMPNGEKRTAQNILN